MYLPWYTNVQMHDLHSYVWRRKNGGNHLNICTAFYILSHF